MFIYTDHLPYLGCLIRDKKSKHYKNKLAFVSDSFNSLDMLFTNEFVHTIDLVMRQRNNCTAIFSFASLSLCFCGITIEE